MDILNAENKTVNIAIDGPSGSGKSYLAKRLAEHYGFVYVDTGALYRTIGLYIQRKGFASTDTQAIVSVLNEIDISMRLRDGKGEVLLFGEAVGDEIRTPKSSVYASDVSKIPEVRAFLLDLQRSIAEKNNTVMDGRDIGTVILPNAQVKIFLFASNEERARRRYLELCEKGISTDYQSVLDDIVWRDRNDRNREIAPAVPAEDAFMLDNSKLDRDATLEAAVRLVDERLGK